MKHICDKDKTIDGIALKLDKHIEKQKKSEEKQEQILNSILLYHEDMRKFVRGANPVITAFTNISTAGDVVSKMIMGLSKLLLSIGVILGVIYSIKKWIMK